MIRIYGVLLSNSERGGWSIIKSIIAVCSSETAVFAQGRPSDSVSKFRESSAYCLR